MASKHRVTIEGSETVSGAADKASGSLKQLRGEVRDMVAPAKDLAKSIKEFLTFGGLATTAAIGIRTVVREIGECETAFIKLHPEMAKAEGSAANYKTASDNLKASVGGLVADGLSPLRQVLITTMEHWTANINAARDYRQALDDLAKNKTFQQLGLSVGIGVSTQSMAAAGLPVNPAAKAVEDAAAKVSKGVEMLNKILASLTEEEKKRLEAYKNRPPAPTAAWAMDYPFAEIGGIQALMAANRSVPWSGFIGDVTGMGQAPSFAQRPSYDPFSNPSVMPAEMQSLMSTVSPLTSILGTLGSQFTSVSMLMQPMQIALQAMVAILQPVVDSVLSPLVGVFVILGQTVGQILTPVIQALAPVIEMMAKQFIWVYNNVIMPMGNGLWAFFTNIGNAIGWLFDKLVALGQTIWYVISFQWGKLGSVDWGGHMQQVSGLNGPLTAIDTSTLASAGAAYINGASGYGTGASSSTTVQKPADVYIYFTIEGNVIGGGGKAEMGRWLVDCIQEALDVGVRPQFLENN